MNVQKGKILPFWRSIFLEEQIYILLIVGTKIPDRELFIRNFCPNCQFLKRAQNIRKIKLYFLKRP